MHPAYIQFMQHKRRAQQQGFKPLSMDQFITLVRPLVEC